MHAVTFRGCDLTGHLRREGRLPAQVPPPSAAPSPCSPAAPFMADVMASPALWRTTSWSQRPLTAGIQGTLVPSHKPHRSAHRGPLSHRYRSLCVHAGRAVGPTNCRSVWSDSEEVSERLAPGLLQAASPRARQVVRAAAVAADRSRASDGEDGGEVAGHADVRPRAASQGRGRRKAAGEGSVLEGLAEAASPGRSEEAAGAGAATAAALEARVVELSALKVSELQTALRALDLPRHGRKAELVARLAAAKFVDGAAPAAAAAAVATTITTAAAATTAGAANAALDSDRGAAAGDQRPAALGARRTKRRTTEASTAAAGESASPPAAMSASTSAAAAAAAVVRVSSPVDPGGFVAAGPGDRAAGLDDLFDLLGGAVTVAVSSDAASDEGFGAPARKAAAQAPAGAAGESWQARSHEGAGRGQDAGLNGNSNGEGVGAAADDLPLSKGSLRDVRRRKVDQEVSEREEQQQPEGRCGPGSVGEADAAAASSRMRGRAPPGLMPSERARRRQQYRAVSLEGEGDEEPGADADAEVEVEAGRQGGTAPEAGLAKVDGVESKLGEPKKAKAETQHLGPPPDLDNLPPWPKMFMGRLRRPSDLAPGDRSAQEALLSSNGCGLALTSLGSAVGRASAAQGLGCMAMVRVKDIFIFDAGDDTQRMLASAFHVKPSKVFRIFLTSLEPESVLGLPGLICTINSSREKGHEMTDIPVHVYGPPGAADFLATMMRISCTMLEITTVVHEVCTGPVREEEAVPYLYSSRSRIWRVVMPPDQLNPRGGVDASLMLFAPDQGRSQKKRGRNAAGGVLSFDARAGFLPWPPLEPGDPTRRGLDPMHLSWTLELDLTARVVVSMLPGARGEPTLVYNVMEAERGGGLVLERATAVGLTDWQEYAQLKAGEAVVNGWGQSIPPSLVISPNRPGRRVLVLGNTPDPSLLAPQDASLPDHRHCRAADVLVAGPVFAKDERERAAEMGGCTADVLGTTVRRLGIRHVVLSRFDSQRLREETDYTARVAAEVAADAYGSAGQHLIRGGGRGGRGGGGTGLCLDRVLVLEDLDTVFVEKNEGPLEREE